MNNKMPSASDLRWLVAVASMMLEEPTACNRKTFESVGRMLAKALPKLRRRFTRELERELREAEVFEFTRKLAALYRDPSTKPSAIIRMIRRSPEPLHTLFDPEMPGPKRWRDAMNNFLSVPDGYPT